MQWIIFDTRRLQDIEIDILGKAAASAVSAKQPSAGLMAGLAGELGAILHMAREERPYVFGLDVEAAPDAGVQHAFETFAKLVDGLNEKGLVWGAILAHVIAGMLNDELTRRAACQESGTVH